MPFEVIPAIDLRGGKCVRLLQGDYAKETVYGDDPVEMALRWQKLGAPRLHVVDLDGARSGHQANSGAVRGIVNAVSASPSSSAAASATSTSSRTGSRPASSASSSARSR